MTHLQNLPCNAHEIAEIEIPSGSVKDSAQTEIGEEEGKLKFDFDGLICLF